MVPNPCACEHGFLFTRTLKKNSHKLDDHVLAGLAVLAADGDVHAAEKLFHALLPRVRNLVRYLVRNDQDVDDLAQDALVTLFRGIPTYRGDGSFRAWADRVTARRIFRSLQARREQAALFSQEDPDKWFSGDGRFSDDSESQSYLWRRALALSLDKLSWEQRQAVVLHFVVGMTVVEVSTEVGAPVETVRSRLRLGMAKLKERFARDLERRVG